MGRLRLTPWLFLISLVFVGPANAHLAMIRQGLESAEDLESNDQFGSALAAGDFNGDGFDDLAVGSPSESLSGLAGAGLVIVVYGSKWGLTHVGATQRSAAIVGGFLDAGAGFGRALVAGDFDGDDIDDLAIGAPTEDISGTIRAGRVYVLHGSLLGLDASADTILTESHGGGSIEADDEFGASLAAGDFNLDGRDDLAIGAPGEDADAGTVFEFHGSANGITRVGAHFFKQADLGGTNTAGDRFGESLASGNFAGSDHPDLAVGTPLRTANALAGAGVVYLILGTGTGLASAGAQSYSGASHAGGAETAAHFGKALAAGQFFTSVYRSLAIGEPERNVGGQIDAGQVVAVRGGAAGLEFAIVGGVRVLTQTGNDGASSDDHFGAVLAAADRRGPAVGSWGADGLDELAVGTPEENGALQSQVNVGLVQIFRGTSSGPSASFYEIYVQEDLGDDSEPGDHLGAALAFGAFDQTGFANLAIGASLENTSDDLRYDQLGQTDLEEFSNAGAVFVSAPWRQVLGLNSRGTVVYNCAFELVYSQRPFDKVRPASTTKVMTALLAAERMAAGHPDHVDSTDVIDDIPQWIDDVGGTAIWTGPGEHIRFVDACRGMVMKSGNDAAYLVGRRIRPELHESDASAFVALMNVKAATIGMSSRTRFSNPAGRDAPEDDLVPAPDRDNYTTPDDMALLLREGMFDPVFRMLLGTTSWTLTRLFDVGDPEDLVPIPWNFQNGMLARVAGALNAIPGPNPQATAAKPGGTTWARNTELFAAEDATGRVIVTRFGIPDGVSTSAQDVALVLLGFQLCDTPQVFPPGGEPQPGPIVRLDEAGTQTDQHHAASATFAPGDGDSVVVEGFLGQGTGTASATITVGRSTEGSLEPQEVVTLTAPCFGHLGYAVHNDDALPAMLQVVASHPPINQTLQLDPHRTTRIGGFTGGSGSPTILQVQNLGSSRAYLSIDEEGYVYPAQISRDATTGPGPFGALLAMGGTGPQPYVRRVTGRGLYLRADGNDANPGKTITLVAHAPDVPVVGVVPWIGPGTDPGRAAFAFSPPAPNPFSEEVRLGFVLDRPARVRIAVFDVRGRRIRMFEESRPAGPGAFVWDGRGTGGVRVPTGVYYYRAFVSGHPVGSGRLIRLTGAKSTAPSSRH